MSVSYGAYTFPEPSPFVSIEDSVVYYKGEADHSSKKISVIGNLTGSSLSAIANAKKDLTIALASPYLSLSTDYQVFENVKPIGIDFEDSVMTTILPYSAEFEYYEYPSFAQLYGVKDVANSWTYTEQQGRIVKATHSISAVGLQIDGESPRNYAIDFVNQNDNGFENISAFFVGDTAYSLVKTEEIDEAKGSYGRTTEYSFSTSQSPLSNKGIVNATVQIGYNKEGGLEGSVNGSIVGDLTGARLTTDDFPPERATQLFRNAVINSRSNFENSVYGNVIAGPTSLNYDVNSGANTLGFSFSFTDPDEQNTNIIHKPKISVSASKDSNVVTVSVNGNISFVSVLDILNPDNFDLDYRMGQVDAFFATVNPYALAVSGYSDFLNTVDTVYEESEYLNPDAESFSITKDPFSSSIDYSYSYSNVEDLSNGQLNNFSFTLTDDPPITITGVQESVSSFSKQKTIDKTLGSISIQGKSDNLPDKLPILKTILEGIVVDKNCFVIDSSFATGESSISYSLNTHYSN